MTSMTHDTDQQASPVAEIFHRPWCNKHVVEPSEDGSGHGFCSSNVTIGGPDGPMVELAEDDGRTVLNLWGSNGDREVSPEEACQVAAALVRAAVLAEGYTQTSATVASNLTRVIAEFGPIEVDKVAELGRLLCVDPLELFEATA